MVVCLFVLLAAAPAYAQDDETIAARVRRHDDEGALALLGDAEAPRLRYLRGRLLDRLGRFAEAARAYPVGDDASALPDEVRADARVRAAVAHARAGDCATAEPLFAPDETQPMVQAWLAQCALAESNLDEAVTRLRTVSRRRAEVVDLFAARLALAEALERAERADEAIEVLTSLVVERPEHPEAARAEAMRARLAGDAAELSFSQRMRRVERLLEVRRFAAAIEAVEAIERPRDRASLRHWLHIKGTALYRERHHYREAAEVLAESARAGGAYAIEDEFHAARALSRADEDRDAVRAYQRFARAHAGHPRAAEASYLAAWLSLRHDYAGAERMMQRFVRSRFGRASPGLARSASWQLGLRAFEAERYREAERRFSESARGDDALVRGRGLYWTARARAARGDRRRAVAAYREALYVEPLHWYAILSRQRLEELGEDTPPPFPESASTDAEPAPEVELPREVRFYAELGLRQDALRELRARERTLRRRDGSRAVVMAYQQLGEANRLVRMLGGRGTTRRRATPGPADRWRWDAAYPRPYPEAAAAAARSVGLTPSHLYAVMRQESGFNPDVVSYADAVGLMQLLPSTAERVAERLGMSVSREMLFDPAVNVRLGAAYVGGLVERFGVPLAFAAFNAGGHRVQAWLEERGAGDLDLFVEHIPFQQTRNYIRRVTTHYCHYRYLEGGGDWPVTLPLRVGPR